MNALKLAKLFARETKRIFLPHTVSYEEKRIRLCQRLRNATGGMVYAGPFATMAAPAIGAWTSNPNLLLGSYEAELSTAIHEIVAQRPPTVINIGSAEGYYATGLARLLPDSTVVAFDSAEEGRTQCLEAARLNKVHVLQYGECTLAALAEVCQPGAAVVCDCEGHEFQLLDPDAVPALRTSFIVCELHDFYNPLITPSLISRFSPSHSAEILLQAGRSPCDYPLLRHFSDEDQFLAMHENRNVRGIPFIGRYLILRPMANRE